VSKLLATNTVIFAVLNGSPDWLYFTGISVEGEFAARLRKHGQPGHTLHLVEGDNGMHCFVHLRLMQAVRNSGLNGGIGDEIAAVLARHSSRMASSSGVASFTAKMTSDELQKEFISAMKAHQGPEAPTTPADEVFRSLARLAPDMFQFLAPFVPLVSKPGDLYVLWAERSNILYRHNRGWLNRYLSEHGRAGQDDGGKTLDIFENTVCGLTYEMTHSADWPVPPQMIERHAEWKEDGDRVCHVPWLVSPLSSFPLLRAG
jgi:hypothetical protein